MRAIKFRAWDRKEKCMISGALEIANIGLGDGSVCVDERTQKDNELDWMQYTGLKDKNGKEIYEGDIIERSFRRRSVVQWSDFFAGFRIGSEGMVEMTEHIKMEVIGNIYETSEVLTGTKPNGR